MSDPIGQALAAMLGEDRVARGAPLAPLTTVKVGGPADWLVEARHPEDVAGILAVARTHGVAVTILGGGSNLLVSDRGVRGIVVRVRGGEVRQSDERHVRADAAVTINGLVRWTISHAWSGLEAWAGTPGTVGGAIFGNAHFRGRNIGELVSSVRLLTPAGMTLDVPTHEMGFGYDTSRLKTSGEVVLWADFDVRPGDPARLRQTARESLAYRKRTQPLHLPSAGCVFQNPDPRVSALPEGIPPSAGALIDRAGLKGRRRGGAQVSESHGNFIVNLGSATAADIRGLIEECRDTVRRTFGVELHEEIVYMGEF